MKFVFLFWDFKAPESKPLNPATDKHISPPPGVTLQLNLDPVSQLLFLGRSGINQSQSERIEYLIPLFVLCCSRTLPHICTMMTNNIFHISPTLSLVPTPSVPDTRIGSMNPAAFRSNRPAKPPSSALHPGERELPLLLHLFFSSFPSIICQENEVTSSGGRLGQRLDHVHKLVTGSDVHPTVLIGQTSIGDTATVNLSGCSFFFF